MVTTCRFYCQECGHAFRTIKAAERASFGDDGCPKCGGSDIDLGRPDLGTETATSPYARAEAGFSDSNG